MAVRLREVQFPHPPGATRSVALRRGAQSTRRIPVTAGVAQPHLRRHCKSDVTGLEKSPGSVPNHPKETKQNRPDHQTVKAIPETAMNSTPRTTTLRRWAPPPARNAPRQTREQAVPGSNGLLMTANEPRADLHSYARAAERSGAIRRIFEPNEEYTGQAWYDGLTRITRVEVEWLKDGRWYTREDSTGKQPASQGCTVDVLIIRASMRTPGRHSVHTETARADVALLSPDDTWPENRVLLSAENTLRPEELVDFLAHACHVPNEPSHETDSQDHQQQEFIDVHYRFACELLLTPDIAKLRTIEHLANRHLAPEWRQIGGGRKLRLILDRDGTATATAQKTD